MIFSDKEIFLTLPLSQSKPGRDWILLKSRRPLYELCLPKVKLKDEQLGIKDKIIPQMRCTDSKENSGAVTRLSLNHPYE